MSQTVAQVSEFELIAKMVSDLTVGPEVALGPGDDAAVVSIDQGLVISTDVMNEGVHFRQDWVSPIDVGHRCIGGALADIEAMGAMPTAVTIALSLPPTTTVDWVDRFISGVRAELESAQVSLVGGDLSSSSIISVAVTAIGQTRGQRVITRSGALPGQAVAHRGLIGQAAAGLAVLSRGFRSPRALVSAYQRPEIPYGAGAEARRHGATAMIDVSDGLVADLEHIAQASGVVIDIDSGTLPMSEPLSAVAHATGRDPLDFLLAGGEDHGLVATFPFGEVPPLWTVVGQVVERGDRDPMVCVDGKQWLGAKGWNHFAVK